MRLIDADELKEDFKARLEKAKNWKENALNNSDDELVIRATATIDFICEVIMTINNAPEVETDIEVVAEDAYMQGYTDGWKERFGEPNERPQGEWIETNSNDENIICPFCKTEFNGDIKLICGGENPYFCPNCGADMQKGGAEK